jgi:hypothetical protein
MPYVVSASRKLNVSARAAFDRLADYDAWSEWMPASFRPVGKIGRLTQGKSFRVKISGMPVASKCKVSVFKDAEEITWRGGVKNVLLAEHRFLFVQSGDDEVEVQSVEAWHGALARLLKFGIEPAANRIGNEQLDALAAAVASSGPTK